MTHSTMTLIARIGGLAAIFALSLGILVGAATTVHAQENGDEASYLAYGTEVDEGDEVVASVDLVACGDAVADSDGAWEIEIPGAEGCDPEEGAIITFTLNGELANETATFVPDGDVTDDGYDADAGIVLTIDGDGDGNGDGDGDSDGDAAATATATPPPAASTGNAGLTSASGSGAALLLLGLLAASLAAGARIATRSR